MTDLRARARALTQRARRLVARRASSAARDALALVGLGLVVWGMHDIYGPFGQLTAGGLLLALVLVNPKGRR